MKKSCNFFFIILFSSVTFAETSNNSVSSAELEQLKNQYEQRISNLEQQIAQKDNKNSSSRFSNDFNPQISLILDGVYSGGKNSDNLLWESIDSINQAHNHDEHTHGEIENGFNLRETELAFSATVNPYFDATALLSISSGGSVAVEEAYFDTRALPSGFKIRAGKFLSGFGYLNAQHPHQWDFVDQNLPYQTLIGEHGLADTGVRLTWLPPTGNWYTQLELELFQGQDQTFASSGINLATARADGSEYATSKSGELNAKKNGPRLTTLFAKFAPELGANHALQFGGSYLFSNQHQEIHDHTAEDPSSYVYALDGKANLWAIDTVYKYDAGKFAGEGNFKLVAEYLRLNKKMNVAFHEIGSQIGEQQNFTQDGYVIQASYGILPKWQTAIRYDLTGRINQLKSDNQILWKKEKSSRFTFALSYILDEFSLFRLQLADAKLNVNGENKKSKQIFLQYQHSLGAHGAHTF